MTQWLFDTLLWTAALIALVLLVRRPVARWFGPQVAYALWALPALRLVLPPITLPAWMAPEGAEAAAATNEILFPEAGVPVATLEGATGISSGSGAAATDLAAPFTPSSLLEAAPLVEIGCAVWLIGAAIFLWRRFSSYFELRGRLLEGAREVGRSGRVRFVESPATHAPLAFGVIDPVIALPEGFMAQPDIARRDLALAHELAHHRAHDLLVNILVQPLFALHWFNPLGHYGWLALRRDQEAACDARVVEHRPTEDRALYADLIAGFAAGPNLALAAPMACPVLGEKSIIHRLRSLNMSDTSLRRRWSGRLLLGAAALALPLTASVSYAEDDAPPSPAPPAAPASAIAPPAPAVAVPVPVSAQAIAEVDPDAEMSTEEMEVEVEVDDVEADGQNVFVIEEVDESDDGTGKKRIKKVEIRKKGAAMSEAEREAIMAELRSELAEADAEMKAAMKEVKRARLEIETDDGAEGRTVIKMECRGNGEEAATVEQGEDGIRKVYMCKSKVMAHALKGLKEARKAIADNPELDPEMRADVLKELDRQISEWKKEHGKS